MMNYLLKNPTVSALLLLMASAGLGLEPSMAALRDRDLALGYASARNQSDGSFSEGVTCRGVLKGGGAVYARLAVSNVGPADGDADIRLRVSLPGGDAHEVSVRRDGGDWTTGRQKLHADLGSASWTVGVKEASLRAENGKVAIALDIKTRLAPLRPAGLDAPLPRGDFYKATILIPHGKVTGHVHVKETGDKLPFTGWVYMVHNQMNKMPFKLATAFHSALDVSWKGTTAMWAYEAPPSLGGGLRGWMMITEKGKLVVYEPSIRLRPMEPKKDAKTGYRIPQLLHVSAPQTSGLKGVIQVTRQTARVDDLASLGRVERFFVERFSKPWSFRNKGKFLMTLPAQGEGGEDRRLTGKLNYTYQQLN